MADQGCLRLPGTAESRRLQPIAAVSPLRVFKSRSSNFRRLQTQTLAMFRNRLNLAAGQGLVVSDPSQAQGLRLHGSVAAAWAVEAPSPSSGLPMAPAPATSTPSNLCLDSAASCQAQIRPRVHLALLPCRRELAAAPLRPRRTPAATAIAHGERCTRASQFAHPSATERLQTSVQTASQSWPASGGELAWNRGAVAPAWASGGAARVALREKCHLDAV